MSDERNVGLPFSDPGPAVPEVVANYRYDRHEERGIHSKGMLRRV